MSRALVLATMLAACGGQSGGRWAEGPPEPRPPGVPVQTPAPSRVVVPTRNVVVGSEEAVAVELQFQGVGGLFRNFFSDPELVGKLGAELGPCIAGGLAVVVITWSEETRIGTITVTAEPEMLACRPGTANGLDMTPLTPLGAALANYRDGVSGKYDVRVASFRTGLKLLEGMNHCAFWLGGQYPPDGTQWKRCADFAGNERCMKGDEHEGVTTLRFGGEDDAYARACFAL